MSAQELYNILINYISGEKQRITNRREKLEDESEYLIGRWANLTTVEHILNNLEPDIFPDLTEDER